VIPLRDSIPRVHTPWATWAIIACNALAFSWTLSLGPQAREVLFHLLGVVPLRFSEPALAAQVGFPPHGQYAFLTYMFLHGGWLHFLANMWTLWIFADNIEDVMGPLRFLCFYVCSGLAALGVHYVFEMHSPVPVVGASGAIAGVMGAYFLLYPHARVTTLVPLFFIPLIFDLPAVIFLGFWFLSQFFSGVAGLVAPGQGGGIAWWAHAGGFVAGAVLLPLFRRPGRCRFCVAPEDDPLRRFPFLRR
jgi:membrane associated rhomboid family serine protease